eukprot:COSAG01_NODE_25883_length_730_cov_0.976228_1_plen_21_part_10
MVVNAYLEAMDCLKAIAGRPP